MPDVDFQVGDAVRVLEGPFKNFVGVVREVPMTCTEPITVGIGLQGREIAVEVNRYHVERIR